MSAQTPGPIGLSDTEFDRFAALSEKESLTDAEMDEMSSLDARMQGAQAAPKPAAPADWQPPIGSVGIGPGSIVDDPSMRISAPTPTPFAGAPMPPIRPNGMQGARSSPSDIERRVSMLNSGVDPDTGKPLDETYLGRVIQSFNMAAPIREAIDAGSKPGVGTGEQIVGATGATVNTLAQALGAPFAPAMALPGVHELMGAVGKAGTAVMRPAARLAASPSAENAARMALSDPVVNAITGRTAPDSPLVDQAAGALFNVATMAATPGALKSAREAWRGPDLPTPPASGVPTGGSVETIQRPPRALPGPEAMPPFPDATAPAPVSPKVAFDPADAARATMEKLGVKATEVVPSDGAPAVRLGATTAGPDVPTGTAAGAMPKKPTVRGLRLAKKSEPTTVTGEMDLRQPAAVNVETNPKANLPLVPEDARQARPLVTPTVETPALPGPRPLVRGLKATAVEPEPVAEVPAPKVASAKPKVSAPKPTIREVREVDALRLRREIQGPMDDPLGVRLESNELGPAINERNLERVLRESRAEKEDHARFVADAETAFTDRGVASDDRFVRERIKGLEIARGNRIPDDAAIDAAISDARTRQSFATAREPPKPAAENVGATPPEGGNKAFAVTPSEPAVQAKPPILEQPAPPEPAVKASVNAEPAPAPVKRSAAVEQLVGDVRDNAYGMARAQYELLNEKELAEVHSASGASNWKGVRAWLDKQAGTPEERAAAYAARKAAREKFRAEAAADEAGAPAPAEPPTAPEIAPSASPKVSAALDEIRAAAKAEADPDAGMAVWRRLRQTDNATAQEVLAAVPKPTPEQIARLPRDMQRAADTNIANGSWLYASLQEPPPPPPSVPGVKGLRRTRGQARMPGGVRGLRRNSGESGAVRIPSGADMDRATEPLRRVYQRLVGDNIDAVAERADTVKPLRAVRQSGINEALRVDPTEQLHQAEMRAVGKKTWGMRVAEKDIARPLDKALRNVPKPDRAEACRYLGGERLTLPSSAQHAKPLLDAASALIHSIRTEMLDRGIISRAVFDEYPRFLSRVMRARLGEGAKFLRSGAEKITREMYRMDAHGVLLDHGADAVSDLVNKTGVKTKVVTGTPAKTLVKFADAASRDAFIEAARQEFGHRKGSSGWFDKFDPLSDADRAALHELVDPSDSFAVTAARGRAKVAAYDLLGDVETIGKGRAGGDWIVRETDPSAPVPAGYVELTSPNLGPLSPRKGSRVFAKADVAEYVNGVASTSGNGAFVTGLVDAFKEWRKDRTVRSWPTTMRNWLAHGQMTAEAGVNILNPLNAKYHVEALRAVSGKNPKLLKELIENGVSGKDWYSEQNRARIADALGSGETEPWRAVMRWLSETSANPEKEFAAARGASSGAFRTFVQPLTNVPGFGKLTRAAGYLYGLQNDLVRIAAYLKLRDKGLSLPDAMRELDAVTDNYSRHGRAQDFASFLPVVGPFARFAWERYRIGYNNLRKHPVALAETLAFSYLAKKAIEAAFADDVTEDEKRAIEQEFGWQAAAAGRDEQNRPIVLDTRYLSSVGPMLAGPETDKYGSTSEAMLAYIQRASGMGLNPAVNVSAAMSTGRTVGGRPVADVFTRDKYGAAGVAFETWREYIGHPIYGRTADALLASLAEVSPTKKTPALTTNDVIVSYLTGLSFGRFDRAQARRNLEALFAAKEAEVVTDLKERRRLLGQNAEPAEVQEITNRGRDIIRGLRQKAVERMNVLSKATPPVGASK